MGICHVPLGHCPQGHQFYAVGKGDRDHSEVRLVHAATTERGVEANHVQRGDRMSDTSTPRELDVIADIVLTYKPKPKTKAQRKRARKAKKNAKAG